MDFGEGVVGEVCFQDAEFATVGKEEDVVAFVTRQTERTNGTDLRKGVFREEGLEFGGRWVYRKED